MSIKIENNEFKKIGRNSFCICGSGKKYKKCCLNKFDEASKANSLIQSSKERLQGKFSDNKNNFVESEEIGAFKMSDIILEYADGLLNKAHTRSEKEKAIMIAIAAWNISCLNENQREQKIKECLHMMNLNENTDEWHTVYRIIQALVNKKIFEYEGIERFIVDYEFIKLDSNNYHLNVISTLSMEDMGAADLERRFFHI